MPYIQTLEYEEAGPELQAVYDQITGARGKLAEVHKIQSLNPAALLAHMELYKQVMFARSPLKRHQREMVGVIVSQANECLYCIRHHQEALLFYWKNEKRVAQLLESPSTAELNTADLALCEYARKLTLTPAKSPPEAIQKLRDAGWEDRAILDATQVIGYFNFVNRMVLGLGVAFTEEEVKGYNY